MNGTVQVSIWIVVGQWVLLFALGLLVVVAYRQLGYMLHLKDIMSNAGSERDGLALETQAPSFSYIPVREGISGNLPQHFESGGREVLLLFADPGCVSCQNALITLEEVAPQVRHKLSLLVMTSSDPELVAAVKEFHSSTFEVGLVKKEVIFKSYKTYTTPFMYIIDAKGVIRAKGLAGSKNDINRVLRKAERLDHAPIRVAYPLH